MPKNASSKPWFFFLVAAIHQSFFHCNLLWERQPCKKNPKNLEFNGHEKLLRRFSVINLSKFWPVVDAAGRSTVVIGHNYLKNNFCTVCLVYLLSLLKILIGSSLCPKQPFFSFRSPFIPSIFFCQTRIVVLPSVYTSRRSTNLGQNKLMTGYPPLLVLPNPTSTTLHTTVF